MRVGKWVNLGFKIIGTVVALSPTIKAVQNSGSDYAKIPEWTLYEYTGYSLTNGSVNPGQTAAGVGAILGGIVLAKIGGFLGKRF